MLNPVCSRDLDEVFEIYMHPAVNPFMNWEPMTKKEFQPLFRELLASRTLYTYKVSDSTAAVIQIERKMFRQSHVAYIGGFAVREKFQNQGLGSKIMRHVLSLLQNEGMKRIELVVESDNPRAIRVYEKMGFEKEGTLKRYMKRASQEHYVDNHIMAVVLH